MKFFLKWVWFINQTELRGCFVFNTYKISFFQNSLAIQKHISKCFLYLLVSFTFKKEVVICLPHRRSHHKMQLLHATKCVSSEEIVSHILIIQSKQWEKAEEMPPNLVAEHGQSCLASPWSFSLTIYLITS